MSINCFDKEQILCEAFDFNLSKPASKQNNILNKIV